MEMGRWDETLAFYAHLAHTAAPEGRKEGEKGRPVALKHSRLAKSRKLPHEQPEIEARDVKQKSLEDVGMSPQVHSPHPARFIAVSEASLELLASSA